MLGKFTYSNPTKLYFGENSIEKLSTELENYGDNVLLVYGGGSIKQNGIYDKVVEILKKCGKNIFEDAGVMPNPTYAKVQDGCEKARKANADLILSVGGGSCCDYAKAVAASTFCDEDAWQKYYVRGEDIKNGTRVIPIGCILTMVGTGSEMNGGSVITNNEENLKLGHNYEDFVFPKFSILDPTYTYTLPKYQMVAGFFDIMSHILEQYFSDTDDCTSDYIMEGLLKSLINSAKIAVKNPTNYEARSNIMWISTWAINTFISKGKTGDWKVHMLGHAVGANTNATHGMTLSAISIPYYKFMMPYGIEKFKRYALNVWNINPNGKTDTQIAEEGLKAMEDFMTSLDLVMNLTDLGVKEEMLDSLVQSAFESDGGFKSLDNNEIYQIFKSCL